MRSPGIRFSVVRGQVAVSDGEKGVYPLPGGYPENWRQRQEGIGVAGDRARHECARMWEILQPFGQSALRRNGPRPKRRLGYVGFAR